MQRLRARDDGTETWKAKASPTQRYDEDEEDQGRGRGGRQTQERRQKEREAPTRRHVPPLTRPDPAACPGDERPDRGSRLDTRTGRRSSSASGPTDDRPLGAVDLKTLADTRNVDEEG